LDEERTTVVIQHYQDDWICHTLRREAEAVIATKSQGQKKNRLTGGFRCVSQYDRHFLEKCPIRKWPDATGHSGPVTLPGKMGV
jgi:hypothetical protein